MSSHCFGAIMVSDKKSTVNLMEDPLYVMRCFSPDAFKSLCLLHLHYNVSKCGSL